MTPPHEIDAGNGFSVGMGKWTVRTHGVLGLVGLLLLLQALTLVAVVWYVVSGFEGIDRAHAAVERSHSAQTKATALFACLIALPEPRRAALMQATSPEAVYLFCPLLRVLP